MAEFYDRKLMIRLLRKTRFIIDCFERINECCEDEGMYDHRPYIIGQLKQASEWTVMALALVLDSQRRDSEMVKEDN